MAFTTSRSGSGNSGGGMPLMDETEEEETGEKEVEPKAAAVAAVSAKDKMMHRGKLSALSLCPAHFRLSLSYFSWLFRNMVL